VVDRRVGEVDYSSRVSAEVAIGLLKLDLLPRFRRHELENFDQARNTSTCLVVVSLLFAVVAREGLEGGGPLALEGLLARVVVLEGLGGRLARVVVLEGLGGLLALEGLLARVVVLEGLGGLLARVVVLEGLGRLWARSRSEVQF
jgi:hypothetical protein